MTPRGTARSGAAGFGFRPAESEHHFVVTVPAGNREDVTFAEHLRLAPEGSGAANGAGDAAAAGGGAANGGGGEAGAWFPAFDPAGARLRAVLSRAKWNAIADEARVEFNRRLRKEGLPAGRWRTGRNPLARLLGKELTLLAWAVEDADPALIPAAVRNWLGLAPEERWWLFTMTAAATGHALHGRNRGWRKAVRFALTENPVDAAAVPRAAASDAFALSAPEERRPRTPRRGGAARRGGAGGGAGKGGGGERSGSPGSMRAAASSPLADSGSAGSSPSSRESMRAAASSPVAGQGGGGEQPGGGRVAAGKSGG